LTIFDLVLIALSLSGDAFAVAAANSAANPRAGTKGALIMGIYFGGFQAIMPCIGYLLGSLLVGIMQPVIHWLAPALIVLIGVKMLWEGIKDDGSKPSVLSHGRMLIQAIATSIDAFAVGITFAALEVNLIPAAALIGIITFIIVLLGAKLGGNLEKLLKNKAPVAGGAILILVGLKMFIENLIAVYGGL
jgi:putative Mn2+ efflux pump MntP